MNINERVEALRKKMAERDLEAYIVPSSDPHQSEYLSDHYKTRKFISGFTGSAGTAVITKKKAGLWTDGRYFLQAEEELAQGPFKLYRLGTEDPSVEDFLKNEVSAFGKIGFDGNCMSSAKFRQLSQSMGNRYLVTDVDYVGDIWEDRPALPSDKAFFFEEKYSGMSISEKLRILRFMMKEREVDYHFLGSLDDICYLYNIRGNDVEDTPVVLSFSLVSQDRAILFIDPMKVSDSMVEPLKEAGVELYDYSAVEDELKEIESQKFVYLNPNCTNINLYRAIPDNVKIKTGVNLTTLMKAIKNEVEISNCRQAFVKDGVALVKFFNWVETGAKAGSVNEKSAWRKLQEFRAMDPDFIEDSFSAIIGYGSNAAIVHYNPMNAKNTTNINNRGLLLVDSGGQYYQGTTDITRTYAMGELNEEEKLDYTLVLKAHIAGMSAKFPKGTTGSYINAVVKQPLFNAGKDFNHGTGHGVGHVLSVHEGPQSFSHRDGGIEIAPGMVTSVEPGLYITDKHGIRLESITHCVEWKETDLGKFYELECLTWVPMDTRPVIVDMLSQDELEWLNNYNKTCYEKLSPFLEGGDLEYLEKMTEPIE